MIGLQYIADTFHMEYKTVAEKIGVSKQTFQDWIKERRKIPQQRLEQLSELFGVKELGLFQKELTDAEKRDIQILYFHITDEWVEVEYPHVDEDGKEIIIKQQVSQNEGIIRYLHERDEEARFIECVQQVVSDDLVDGNENKRLIEQLLTVLDKEPHRKSIELVLHYLTDYQSNKDWGGIHPSVSKYEHNGFFEKLDNLLKENGLSID
ncbi:helix-turn-helix domain-containing protein [Paenibacillus sp. OAS669]|uniref:helix-turn-helix domain-containing protein n=1 Tax=Paenibacillus sp. OAS669 TaxID=2663821 RepID=UPI00178C02DB|nr:helix-turn-helix transcriptional regulator [Paenibacillus sp. OAS669]MBE1446165.1 transcriptional regulator with XRE-family HTH domain [Paenibacillus sp. OAS669]